MAKKTPPAYNPLLQPMPTLSQLQQQAAKEAQAQQNADLSALPSNQFITGLNQALGSSLASNQQHQADIARGIVQDDASGFNLATHAGSALTGALGAGPLQQTTGAHGLLGAMSANLAAGLGGAVNAASARGRQDIANLEGQRGAVRAQRQSNYQKRLDALKQDAFQTSVARQNALLASGKLDQATQNQQSDEAYRQSQLDLARQRLALQIKKADREYRLAKGKDQKVIGSKIDKYVQNATKIWQKMVNAKIPVTKTNATNEQVTTYEPRYSSDQIYRSVYATLLNGTGLTSVEAKRYAEQILGFPVSDPTFNQGVALNGLIGQ